MTGHRNLRSRSLSLGEPGETIIAILRVIRTGCIGAMNVMLVLYPLVAPDSVFHDRFLGRLLVEEFIALGVVAAAASFVLLPSQSSVSGWVGLLLVVTLILMGGCVVDAMRWLHAFLPAAWR